MGRKKNKLKNQYDEQYRQAPNMPPPGWGGDEMPGWGQQPPPWGDPSAWQAGSMPPWPPYPYPPQGAPGASYGAPPHGAGLLGWLGNRQMEQFILGLLLGGAAAYVLGDPDKRARLMRMAMKLYTGVAGSVEEFKEQIADLKAEVAAEQGHLDS